MLRFELAGLSQSKLIQFIGDGCVLVVNRLQSKLNLIEQAQEFFLAFPAFELRITIAQQHGYTCNMTIARFRQLLVKSLDELGKAH